MRKLRNALFAALVCGVTVPAAFAGPSGDGDAADTVSAPAPSVPSATLGALAQAQSEAALLKAQLEIAKLKAEIQKVKSGKSDSGPKPSATGYPAPLSSPFPMAEPLAGAQSSRMPRVLGISGTGSRLTATLALPDGGTLSVQPGQNLPPYGRVTRITDRGVFLAHDRKVEPLPFVSASSGNAGSGSLPATTGFPTPPGAGFANPMASAPMYGPPSIPSGSLPPKSTMPMPTE